VECLLKLWEPVGHGEADKYKGDFNNEIMVVGQYDAEEVRGKIYHFVSCQTAKALGPDAIRKGCRAYFGYDQDFAFCPEHADVFFQCDSQIDLALAQGRTAGDAHQQAIDKYNDYIAAFMAAGDSITAAALGGVALQGGKGGISGTVFAVLLLGDVFSELSLRRE